MQCGCSGWSAERHRPTGGNHFLATISAAAATVPTTCGRLFPAVNDATPHGVACIYLQEALCPALAAVPAAAAATVPASAWAPVRTPESSL